MSSQVISACGAGARPTQRFTATERAMSGSLVKDLTLEERRMRDLDTWELFNE